MLLNLWISSLSIFKIIFFQRKEPDDLRLFVWWLASPCMLQWFVGKDLSPWVFRACKNTHKGGLLGEKNSHSWWLPKSIKQPLSMRVWNTIEDYRTHARIHNLLQAVENTYVALTLANHLATINSASRKTVENKYSYISLSTDHPP